MDPYFLLAVYEGGEWMLPLYPTGDCDILLVSFMELAYKIEEVLWLAVFLFSASP